MQTAEPQQQPLSQSSCWVCWSSHTLDLWIWLETGPMCESSNRPNMKTVRVAAAVALLFAFVWIQESSAQADAQMEEMEGPEDVDIPVELKVEEVSVDAMTSPYYRSREKRGIKCKFCCGCCTPGVCGLCCRF
ncbi:hypothetical protein NL108_000095 [Boleophthalmus pectinirostris]|nr:hypothetical protein NL108_000095 [Boleophthalmus pectinirostris]